MSDDIYLQDSPTEILSAPPETRLAKARNSRTEPQVLSILASDRSWFVRSAVAGNINTPKDHLQQLARDSDFRVRDQAESTLSKIEALARANQKQKTSSSNDSSKNNPIIPSGMCLYARYFCGEFERRATWKEKQDFEKANPHNDTIDYAPIFDGVIYPTLGESVSAQIKAFGWQFDDDRRKSEPGGTGPMTPEKLARVLHTLQAHPYDRINFYYAWKKPDDTLFMIGTYSNSLGQILLYEFEPYFNDYGGRFVTIDPLSGAMIVNGVRQDPVDFLVSQVANYTFIGSWCDHDILIDDPHGFGRIAAYGRWELAKEHILGGLAKEDEEKAPGFLDDTISEAEGLKAFAASHGGPKASEERETTVAR